MLRRLYAAAAGIATAAVAFSPAQEEKLLPIEAVEGGSKMMNAAAARNGSVDRNGNVIGMHGSTGHAPHSGSIMMMSGSSSSHLPLPLPLVDLLGLRRVITGCSHDHFSGSGGRSGQISRAAFRGSGGGGALRTPTLAFSTSAVCRRRTRARGGAGRVVLQVRAALPKRLLAAKRKLAAMRKKKTLKLKKTKPNRAHSRVRSTASQAKKKSTAKRNNKNKNGIKAKRNANPKKKKIPHLRRRQLLRWKSTLARRGKAAGGSSRSAAKGSLKKRTTPQRSRGAARSVKTTAKSIKSKARAVSSSTKRSSSASKGSSSLAKKNRRAPSTPSVLVTRLRSRPRLLLKAKRLRRLTGLHQRRSAIPLRRAAAVRPRRGTGVSSSTRPQRLARSNAKKNGTGVAVVKKRRRLRGHQLQKMRYNKRVAAIARLWRAQQKARLQQQQQQQLFLLPKP